MNTAHVFIRIFIILIYTHPHGDFKLLLSMLNNVKICVFVAELSSISPTPVVNVVGSFAFKEETC